jgi:hypothetical protein
LVRKDQNILVPERNLGTGEDFWSAHTPWKEFFDENQKKKTGIYNIDLIISVRSDYQSRVRAIYL